MGGEALYERYKGALKRGHVASLRGRLEDALVAYAEAAEIAPERATPHASAGTALLRAGHPAEAIPHFAAALDLVPGDDAALLGRAQALAVLGRRREAADAFDAVADARVAAGRLADAVDAARRALELAEGRARRRSLERLIEQLRFSEPDEPGRRALDQALRLLDGPAVTHPAAGLEAAGAGDRPPDEDAPLHERHPEPGANAAAAWPAPEAAATEAVAPIRAALDRDLPDDADADALAIVAELAVDDGQAAAALARLLDLAAVHRRDGNRDAALDDCYAALSLGPDDVDVHLALAELYLDRGWNALATEKLDLLERIAALDEDGAALARVAAARASAG